MKKAFNSTQFDHRCFPPKIANNSGYFLPYIFCQSNHTFAFTATLSESQMYIISIPKPLICIKSHSGAKGCWNLPAACIQMDFGVVLGNPEQLQ